ncbi:hypothetical protein [Paenibacillus sp. YAF4_2]|uniref:hypothetical protein n=1 Tax=Paenibacillus sp. YAF4_2 TaxID=3233085 RepID=UPI003F96415A
MEETETVIQVTGATLGHGDGKETAAAPAARSVTVTTLEGLPGDVNGDDKVSIGGQAIVATHYGKNTPYWSRVE